MKILIIDDERSIRNSMKEILSDEGYIVETAEDGAAGYEMASKGHYDVIFCDIKMPGLDGVEVLGDAKADYRQLKPRNSLEKGLFAAWDRGERFHDTGMFLLKEEVEKIGTDPYRKEA